MGKLCELGGVCEVLSSQLWDWGFSSSGDGPGKRLTVLLCHLKLGFLIPAFLGIGCQLPRATIPLLLPFLTGSQLPLSSAGVRLGKAGLQPRS